MKNIGLDFLAWLVGVVLAQCVLAIIFLSLKTCVYSFMLSLVAFIVVRLIIIPIRRHFKKQNNGND